MNSLCAIRGLAFHLTLVSVCTQTLFVIALSLPFSLSLLKALKDELSCCDVIAARVLILWVHFTFSCFFGY